MIKKLQNITKKSFNDYCFATELKECNIFFGTNGSGKSSLANWIFENSQSVKKFDSDYVQNNISAKDTLSGVKLIVGSERIEIEEAILNIEEANNNLNSTISNIEKKINDYKQEIYDFMNIQLNEARLQFKLSRNINQKRNARVNTVEALQLWENDIISNSELNDFSTSSDIELKLNELKLKYSKISFYDKFQTNHFNELNILLKEKIKKPEFEMSMTLNQWLELGIHLHNHSIDSSGKTICKFCKNTFDYEEIKIDIFRKINSDFAEKLKELEKYKSIFKNLEDSINFDEIDNIDRELSTKLKIDIKEIIKSINNKLNNPESIIDKKNDFLSNYTLLRDEILEYKLDLNNKITEQEKLLNEIESVAKSWVAKKILQKYPLDRVINSLSSFEQKIKMYNKLIFNNRKWVLENTPKGELQPFADLVNSQFSRIGLNIECILYEENYLLQNKKDKSIIVNTKDLSEGERRLLGFLHFYYDLYKEAEISLKENIELILIDDPITSLDSDNRYYLTELLNLIIGKLTKLGAQMFIFTHSSMDFHNFGYGLDSKKILKCTIYKNELGNSEIEMINGNDIKNYSDYYKSNFRTLYKFSKISNSKIGIFENSVRFGNTGRLVFESHARSNYRIENATGSSIEKLIEYYNIPETKVESFKEMIDIINSLSHGLSFYDSDVNEISPRSVRDTIRKLLSILYLKDKNHVIAMLGFSSDDKSLEEIGTWF
ncbi:AAA family ATPase [Streptococcus uberis]|uniref:AAA family ATPase n=1 Tax=Streptococcus uberis TaxID=1349 RepID=UPI0012B646AD|nr:AAA family ATPase [Streptococcus uberis]MTB48076.1 AAA family ATPase [Streptococcus uberis]